MTTQKFNISYCEELHKLGFEYGEIETALYSGDLYWYESIRQKLYSDNYEDSCELELFDIKLSNNRLECELKLTYDPPEQYDSGIFCLGSKKIIIKTFSFTIQGTGTTEAILGQACKEQVFKIANFIKANPDLRAKWAASKLQG